MRKTLFFIIAILLVTSIKAQQIQSDFFTVNDTIIGKFMNGDDVVAKCYKTKFNIYKWNWNKENDVLFLQLRQTNKRKTSYKKEGVIAMIDLSDMSVKWNKDVNYSRVEVDQIDDILFYTEKKKSFCIDAETGSNLWQNNFDYYYIYPPMNIAVGYPKGEETNMAFAINLSNGEALWTKEIDRTLGWNDVYMLTDSVLLIATNGVTSVNLATGEGWTYNARENKTKVGEMIAVNAAGILLGALTGVYMYQTTPEQITGIVSNILIDDEDGVILASRDVISRINRAGELIWSADLPKKETSKSSVFLRDSTIYMINKGYAFSNGASILYGEPYIASFDLHRGNQNYLQIIPAKRDAIRSYQVVDDMLFLVFGDRVATYSLTDGSVINEKVIELDKNEQLSKFVESGVFVRNSDSVFVDVAYIYPEKNLLITNNNRIFSITDGLEADLLFDEDEVYAGRINKDDYRVISNNNKDFIICTADGTPTFTFHGKPNMFMTNNKLFVLGDDSFWVYNLE